MQTEIQLTLKELDRIDEFKATYEEIKNLISKLRPYSLITVNLQKGQTIIRGRMNEDNTSFFSKCQLTYTPQQFNNNYLRASTPFNSMFYGIVTTDDSDVKNLIGPRIQCIAEISEWFTNKKLKGHRRVTFGYWEVKRPLRLYAVVQHKSFRDNNTLTKELYSAFQKYSLKNPEIAAQTFAITDYFAKEFAKPVTLGEFFKYKKSAILTESLMETSGLSGIFYPSVRNDGNCYNIALRTEIADNYLELVAALECSIYKLYDRSVIDAEKSIVLNSNQSNFLLKPIDSPRHVGQEKCLNELGLTSIIELA